MSGRDLGKARKRDQRARGARQAMDEAAGFDAAGRLKRPVRVGPSKADLRAQAEAAVAKFSGTVKVVPPR